MAGRFRSPVICQDGHVNPLRLVEVTPDRFRLELIAGTTSVDTVIVEVGHEPNGPFWEAIAGLLISTQAPGLGGRFAFDSEAGAFCAVGQDREALERLETLLRSVISDQTRIRELIALADSTGTRLDS